MKSYYSIKEIAEAMGVHSSTIARRRKKDPAWPKPGHRKVQGGRSGYEEIFDQALLSEDIRSRLDLVESYRKPPGALPAVGQRRDLAPEQQELAATKATLLSHYRQAIARAPWGRKDKARDEFMLAYNSGIAWPETYKALGELSWKTLEGWKAALQKAGGDTSVLVDRRGKARRGKSRLIEEEKKVILACAMSPNAPRISEAIRSARAVLRSRGIEPSLSRDSYRRFLDSWVDRNYPEWVYLREGKDAWKNKCAPYAECDYSNLHVGDEIVADGHPLNFEIINPFTGKPSNHMTLLLFSDMKSTYPLGWEIMPSENVAAIHTALFWAILRLGKIPRMVYIDNGRAFRAKYFKGCNDFNDLNFQGLYARLGIEVSHAQSYNAQAKPIERFFGTFGELERRNLISYTGTSIATRPPRLRRNEKLHRQIHEKAFGPNACITLEQAHRAIAAWFDEYARREKTGGHLKGLTPLEVFEAGKGPGVDKTELAFLMMAEEVKGVGRNGIYHLGKNYYHPALHSRQVKREKMLYRYHLRDSSVIYVFEADGSFLCEATPLAGVHRAARLGTDEDRQKLAEFMEHKRHLEKTDTASARAFLEAEVLPEHRRQMAEIGVLPEPGQPAGKNGKKVRQLPAPLTEADKANLAAEVEEAQRLHTRMEAADFNARLEEMSEADRYGHLLEMKYAGQLVPGKWQRFMKLYEEMDEYARGRDYWDSQETAFAIMYRKKERADGEASARN